MKTVIAVVIVVILLVIVAVCSSGTDPISLEVQNMDIVRLSFVALEEGDFSSMADLYSPDFLQYSPDFKDPVTWTEYELSCRIVHASIPKLQFRIVDIFAVKDKVAVRSIWEFPVDPSWSKYCLASVVPKGSAISIFRIEDDLIIEEWCEFDPAIIKRFCSFYKSYYHMR